MATKYFILFAIICVVATVLIVPSESTPVTNELGAEVNLMNAAPVDTNRQGRFYYGGYPMGGYGGGAASASASASASSGGFGMGGYPMGMYGK